MTMHSVSAAMFSFGVRFGPGSVFGSQNPSRFFDLPSARSELPRQLARHAFGFGRRAEAPSGKRLGFLNFAPHKLRGRGTHNPLVEGSSPSGPTISIKIMLLWR